MLNHISGSVAQDDWARATRGIVTDGPEDGGMDVVVSLELRAKYGILGLQVKSSLAQAIAFLEEGLRRGYRIPVVVGGPPADVERAFLCLQLDGIYVSPSAAREQPELMDCLDNEFLNDLISNPLARMNRHVENLAIQQLGAVARNPR